MKSPASGDTPAKISRSCDVGNMCLEKIFGYVIECCDNALCNVGAIANDDDNDDDDEDDDASK